MGSILGMELLISASIAARMIRWIWLYEVLRCLSLSTVVQKFVQIRKGLVNSPVKDHASESPTLFVDRNSHPHHHSSPHHYQPCSTNLTSYQKTPSVQPRALPTIKMREIVSLPHCCAYQTRTTRPCPLNLPLNLSFSKTTSLTIYFRVL